MQNYLKTCLIENNFQSEVFGNLLKKKDYMYMLNKNRQVIQKTKGYVKMMNDGYQTCKGKKQDVSRFKIKFYLGSSSDFFFENALFTFEVHVRILFVKSISLG